MGLKIHLVWFIWKREGRKSKLCKHGAHCSLSVSWLVKGIISEEDAPHFLMVPAVWEISQDIGAHQAQGRWKPWVEWWVEPSNHPLPTNGIKQSLFMYWYGTGISSTRIKGICFSCYLWRHNSHRTLSPSVNSHKAWWNMKLSYSDIKRWVGLMIVPITA